MNTIFDILKDDECSVCGQTMVALQRWEPAERFFRQAIQLSPANLDHKINLSLPLMHTGRKPEAEKLLREVLLIAPDHPVAWLNLGTLYFQDARYEDAWRAFKLGSEIPAKKNVFAHNLGSAALYLGKMELAIREFAAGYGADRDDYRCEMALGMLQMQQGKWEGLRHYEARLKNHNPFPLPETESPIWPGRIGNRTVMVCSEQGAGDVFFFARYAAAFSGLTPDLKLILLVERSLAGIMYRWPGFETVVPRVQHVTLPRGPNLIPKHDYQVAIGSLMDRWHALGNEVYVPPTAPPIVPTGKGKIGICWRGNPGHGNDRYRSAELAFLLPLLTAFPLHRWVNLQQNATEEERRQFEDNPELTRWEDTLAVLADCSLVITVDTAVAHLAASLGIPTWIMLPAVAVDWRWGLEGERTKWYPSARLYRARVPEHWDDVVEQMRKDLVETW